MTQACDLDPIVDTDRYPVSDLAHPQLSGIVLAAHRALAETGVVALEGFMRPDAVRRVADDALALRQSGHLQDARGTPYLEAPDESFGEEHPRRSMQHSRTTVLAFDLVPAANPLRRLFESDAFTVFLAAILGRGELFRMDDPLGALNLTVMEEDDQQGWHYDSTDFVVSLAVQSSDDGGEFECARDIRSGDPDGYDENYDEVGAVLRGDAPDRVARYPMRPGTLMLFHGRCSLHRVAPVRGTTPRIVGLLGYATRPGTNSSDGLKMVRYGRTAPIESP